MKHKAPKALREAVCEANVELFRRGLAHFTFGNASAVDRERGHPAMKRRHQTRHVTAP